MKFGKVGLGLAGIVLASASLFGGSKTAKAATIDVTSTVYNSVDMDSTRDGRQSRIDYSFANTVATTGVPLTDYYNSVRSINLLGAGIDNQVYRVSFDRTNWNSTINSENISMGSNNYNYNIQPGSTTMIVSMYFDGVNTANEGVANFYVPNNSSTSFDSVTNLSVPVPEPATLALLGAGTAGFLATRGRKGSE